MNIKTFRAGSLQSALAAVRRKFGENAKVLHTREFQKSRFLGLGRRTVVEITATEGDSFFEFLRESPYDVEVAPSIGRQRYRTETKKERNEEPVPLGCWSQLTAEQLNPTVLQRNLILRFQQDLRFGGPLRLVKGKRRVVALVGPTGVGKTTTIAKLAAHYKLKEFKRVALLSMDAFRIAAAEQLRQYAQTLGVPMETVSEPERLHFVMQRLEDYDLLLIDTPGTSPRNAAKLAMIGAALDAADVDETHLLLSATSSTAVLVEAVQAFQPLGVVGLTLTKFDEAVGLGNLYPFLKDDYFPLRFLATGQNVSGDLEVAAPPRLASLGTAHQ
jgi:flagellar biosynthesis protein FlhF